MGACFQPVQDNLEFQEPCTFWRDGGRSRGLGVLYPCCPPPLEISKSPHPLQSSLGLENKSKIMADSTPPPAPVAFILDLLSSQDTNGETETWKGNVSCPRSYRSGNSQVSALLSTPHSCFSFSVSAWEVGGAQRKRLRAPSQDVKGGGRVLSMGD